MLALAFKSKGFFIASVSLLVLALVFKVMRFSTCLFLLIIFLLFSSDKLLILLLLNPKIFFYCFNFITKTWHFYTKTKIRKCSFYNISDLGNTNKNCLISFV